MVENISTSQRLNMHRERANSNMKIPYFPLGRLWCSLGSLLRKALWIKNVIIKKRPVLPVISKHLVSTQPKYGCNSCHWAHNPAVSKYRQRSLSFLPLPPVHPRVMTDPWEEPFVGNWAYLIFKIPGALLDNKNVPILGYIFLAELKHCYAQKTELCLLN